MRRLIFVFVLLLLFSLLLTAAYDFSKLKERVSEFTLDNGLKFILLEDHSVPIASFVTYVNVGGSDEQIGIFGISHFLEHMAFRGTSEIGTKDIKAERKILAKTDALFDRLIAEKDNLSPDEEKIKKMEAELEKLKEEATTYVIPNEFDATFTKNGGVGLNAGTSKDATKFYVSLPSNKIELWAYLESSRFTDPVYREFYKERGVIQEERRWRTENSPIGKLIEELQAIAFKDHPYHVNGIGPMSNIQHITRADMYRYFNANYTAKNMVIGITGDIYPEQVKKLAQKYFSKIRPGQRNPRVFTGEPEQPGEKTITIYEDSQPTLIIAYHAPAVSHRDFIKFGVLDRLLTAGRSSRLYKRMIIEDKSAQAIFSLAGYPGDKYPTLYLVLAIPNSGYTNTGLIEVIDKEIEKIKKDSITEEELQSAKTRVIVNEMNGLQSNHGLLTNLLDAEVKLGSWEKAFDEIKTIEKITAADIRELVKTYLITSNRSIGRIEKKIEEEVKK